MPQRKGPYPVTRHDVAAQMHAFQHIERLEGKLERPNTDRVRRVESLPLIIRKSQWVKFADRYFYLKKEGLYRFWDWGRTRWETTGAKPQSLSKERAYSSVILFRDDILTLLAGLATVHVHGLGHHNLLYKEQVLQAKNGLLSLTCGNISMFCAQALKPLGWRTRLTGCFRLEGEWDTHDCGHRQFEFYWPQKRKWVLADVDMRQLFVRQGRFLDLGELTRLVRQNKPFQLRPLTLSSVSQVDTSDAVQGDFSGFNQFDPAFTHPPTMLKWFRRMFAVPLIEFKGKWHFYCEDDNERKRAETYSTEYSPMPKNQWYERFYG